MHLSFPLKCVSTLRHESGLALISQYASLPQKAHTLYLESTGFAHSLAFNNSRNSLRSSTHLSQYSMSCECVGHKWRRGFLVSSCFLVTCVISCCCCCGFIVLHHRNPPKDQAPGEKVSPDQEPEFLQLKCVFCHPCRVCHWSTGIPYQVV